MKARVAASVVLCFSVAVTVADATAAQSSCPSVATPSVVAGETWVTLTGHANPNGVSAFAHFVIAGSTTYRTQLGQGRDSVDWQTTIFSLRPRTRYTAVAVVLARGCRVVHRTRFTTANFVSTPGDVRSTVVTGAPASEALPTWPGGGADR
jgi:hypothetical protein